MKACAFVILFVSCCFAEELFSLQKPLREGWHLVQLNEQGPPFWVDPETLESFTFQNVHFLDITFTQDTAAYAPKIQQKTDQIRYPDAPRQQVLVNALAQNLNVTSLRNYMQTFTSFNTRYHTSVTGIQSANWIAEQCQDIIAQSGRNDISVQTISFNGSPQPNVVARIEGSTAVEDIVILGAHQDSVNSQGGNPATNRSPGADDDGSGSMTTLEVFRALVAGGFRPERPVEFQWYAAEEVGLVGSAALANSYAQTGRSVNAMMQLDMDAYAPTNPRIFLITDFTTADLNAFLRLLVTEYLDIPWQNDICGYACSDHASFFRAGFPSSHPFESTFNTAIHTINDDLNRINYDYMMHFARLAVAYLAELGTL